MIKQFAKSVVPASLWLRLSGMRAEAQHLISQFGPNPGPNLVLSIYADRFSKVVLGRPGRVRRLRLPGYRFPICYRLGTSDLGIIGQILIRSEYECVSQEPDVSLIIDCGANIGCTSFFFLHRYPNARVIAVEPDPGNFEVCRRNLEPFGDRVVLVNAAVWPSARPLRVVREQFRGGGECAFRVCPASDDESMEVEGVTVLDLIKKSGLPTIDILKIDIETAEVELFSTDVQDWLSRTRLLAIELHGPECERVFFDAVGGRCMDITTSGELTICRGFEGSLDWSSIL